LPISGEQTVNKNASDVFRTDWLYAVQLGQLRRRVLKCSEPVAQRRWGCL